MADSKKWQQALNSLEIWASDRGYHVNFFDKDDDEKDNCICAISKIIDIDGSLPTETQVYYLLHECGHALIFENGNIYDRNKIKDSKKDCESKEYKVMTVLEEAEAWKRAHRLAIRLYIPIEDERWEKEVVDALHKYMVWATDEGAEDDNKSKDSR